jgi:hypothetical protein
VMEVECKLQGCRRSTAQYWGRSPFVTSFGCVSSEQQ